MDGRGPNWTRAYQQRLRPGISLRIFGEQNLVLVSAGGARINVEVEELAANVL